MQDLKWKILSRAVKLFVLGCLTQGADIWLGGSGVDIHNMRFPGILQRIAWAYLVVGRLVRSPRRRAVPRAFSGPGTVG
jgi:predicted acyltransferase